MKREFSKGWKREPTPAGGHPSAGGDFSKGWKRTEVTDPAGGVFCEFWCFLWQMELGFSELERRRSEG